MSPSCYGETYYKYKCTPWMATKIIYLRFSHCGHDSTGPHHEEQLSVEAHTARSETNFSKKAKKASAKKKKAAADTSGAKATPTEHTEGESTENGTQMNVSVDSPAQPKRGKRAPKRAKKDK
ncbi:hypothetical protein GQ600_12926 [Phytophthora cactorum]|nr:hypothetical protein GQ600_12926 [Phytophthora cactorum]